MPSSSKRVGPSAAHAFVDDLDVPVLSPDDFRHLFRVMRLRDGETVTVSDGRGSWRACAVSGSELEPAGEVITSPAEEPEVAVAFALTKAGKPELVVQKLTEVGVDRIIPFTADRSIVRWDSTKSISQQARWQEVARQASMQSRRTRLPVVEPVSGFASVVTRPGAAVADMDGGELSLERPLVLIGPEGGWSPEERAQAATSVDLGPTVLRAETAAIAAGIRLCALRTRYGE